VALEQLAADSTIFAFEAFGSPADFYVLRFHGRGLEKRNPKSDVQVRDVHVVHIRLGAAYPRMMPELAWQSPIFHPNISPGGVVCLGGYGTYWVPSLALADLCTMLWDMARFANFDESSPYNREAAAWAKTQQSFELPIDPRPLRDKLATSDKTAVNSAFAYSQAPRPAPPPEVIFLGDVVETDVVEAELVAPPAGSGAAFFIR
jgi:hypothetical protein